MPGILPMKVIKVGVNAQTRIAQACDRCRSKKIRCDGIRPCCSQCSSVGFECKTSDKLSRRAFPRGYTESLEERVRVLEAEVRELKDLLDEKDEKIDVLSRIHSQSSRPLHLPSPRRSPETTPSSITTTDDKDETMKDDIFKVQQSPYLCDDGRAESYFSGTSSTRTMIESFKDRVQETGRSAADIDISQLLATTSQPPVDPSSINITGTTWKAPPRLVADQLVNIFFQEWAPLFPVLHRPTFLSLYEKYTNDFESVTDKADIAQINLVFGIATLSKGPNISADIESFETQWKAAASAIITHSSMPALQVLVLAQLYCIQQGDLTTLLTYKGLATSLSARLGLHQSQKRFALGTLTCETRKKVFWTLFTLDGFTAVMLGLPKHLKDEDVHCEYPVDADDEYVSEQGFQPSLPGEFTRLSGALALFRASRVLSRVLEEVFPARPSYELSLKKLASFSDELDSWYNSLASHLRLQFALDKPSTNVTSSRSPILALAYHYIRALIQRPAICASLGSRSSSSMMAMASSCKHMVQIIDLLDERGMSFAFCLNRSEVLILSGFGLLFQSIGLEPHSKILKDNSKTITAIVQHLNVSTAPCTPAFKRVANMFKEPSSMPTLSRQNSNGTSTAESPTSTRKQLKAIAARLSSSIAPKIQGTDGSRRHSISLHPQDARNASQPSLHPPTYPSRSEPARSPVNMFSRPASLGAIPSAPVPTKPSKHRHQPSMPNLDFLSFGGDPDMIAPPTTTIAPASLPVKPDSGPSDWERLLGNLDNGETNIFDACYGGPPVEALLDAPPLRAHPPITASPPTMDQDLWAMYPSVSNPIGMTALPHEDSLLDAAGSILSFSTDDGLSSGEELTAEWTSASSAHEEENAYAGLILPEFATADDVTLDAAWGLMDGPEIKAQGLSANA